MSLPIRVMLVIGIGVPLALIVNSLVPAGDVVKQNYDAGRPTTPLLVATGLVAAWLGRVRLRSGARAWLAALAGFAVAAAAMVSIGLVDRVLSGGVPSPSQLAGGLVAGYPFVLVLILIVAVVPVSLGFVVGVAARELIERRSR